MSLAENDESGLDESGLECFVWLPRPAFLVPVAGAVNDPQDGDGLVPLGFIAKGVGDDVREAADHLFVRARHAAFSAAGRCGEGPNSLVDPISYTLSGGWIVFCDVQDAAEIVLGVL